MAHSMVSVEGTTKRSATNMFVLPFVPQLSVLRHPNLKART